MARLRSALCLLKSHLPSCNVTTRAKDRNKTAASDVGVTIWRLADCGLGGFGWIWEVFDCGILLGKPPPLWNVPIHVPSPR